MFGMGECYRNDVLDRFCHRSAAAPQHGETFYWSMWRADGIYKARPNEANVDDRETTVRIARILVALDGSSDAEIALPKAVELAKQNAAAKVVLVRAVDPARLAARTATCG